ncbi:MAG: sulfocyanin-like copper-binding protein [Gemmatimonadota bacterium]
MPTLRSTWTLWCAATVATAVPAAAQNGADKARPAIDKSWLSFDAATKTATFQLVAGLTGLNGALNFNGYRDGELVFVVPAGWTTVIKFVNHDGMLPHSAEIIPDQDPVPQGPVDAAIPRAYTTHLAEGLPPQGKDTMRFTAQPPGKYRIFCAVPGHGLTGMWIRLEVSATAKEPSIVAHPPK